MIRKLVNFSEVFSLPDLPCCSHCHESLVPSCKTLVVHYTITTNQIPPTAQQQQQQKLIWPFIASSLPPPPHTDTLTAVIEIRYNFLNNQIQFPLTSCSHTNRCFLVLGCGKVQATWFLWLKVEKMTWRSSFGLSVPPKTKRFDLFLSLFFFRLSTILHC